MKNACDFLLQSPPLHATSRLLCSAGRCPGVYVFQGRKPHDHLKETTTLLSVKVPLSLFETSHYQIIILRAEIPESLPHWIYFWKERVDVFSIYASKQKHERET